MLSRMLAAVRKHLADPRTGQMLLVLCRAVLLRGLTA